MPAAQPFVDRELVGRLERVLGAFSVAWLEGLADGPAGVRLERFGAVTVSVAPSRPELDFMNRIHGLPQDPEVLDEVLSLYRREGIARGSSSRRAARSLRRASQARAVARSTWCRCSTGYRPHGRSRPVWS